MTRAPTRSTCRSRTRRFAPDVLEAAARRAVEAWAEAVDGDDAALERIASPEAVAGLLYGGDATRATRLVVRGPRVKRIRIAAVQVEQVPATMTVELELGGRRYVEDRDTAAVVSGSKDSAATFTERWTLALDGPADAPWRIVGVGAERAGGAAVPSGGRIRLAFRERDLRRRHRPVRALRTSIRPPVPPRPPRLGADRGRHRDRGRDGAARRGALVHAGDRVLGGRSRGRGRDARHRSGPLEPHRGRGLAGPRRARRAEPAAAARAARAARPALRARLGGAHLGRPLGARRGRDGARRATTGRSSTPTSRSAASSASAARCLLRGPAAEPDARPAAA